MKSPIRWSKCSGSTRRLIEKIVRHGFKPTKRRRLALEVGVR